MKTGEVVEHQDDQGGKNLQTVHQLVERRPPGRVQADVREQDERLQPASERLGCCKNKKYLITKKKS